MNNTVTIWSVPTHPGFFISCMFQQRHVVYIRNNRWDDEYYNNNERNTGEFYLVGKNMKGNSQLEVRNGCLWSRDGTLLLMYHRWGQLQLLGAYGWHNLICLELSEEVVLHKNGISWHQKQNGETEWTRTLGAAGPGFEYKVSQMTALWTRSVFYFPPRKQDDDYLTGLGWGVNHHVCDGVKAGHLKGVQQILSFPKPGGWYLQRPQKPSFPFIYAWSLNCEAAGWKIQVFFFFFSSSLWV